MGYALAAAGYMVAVPSTAGRHGRRGLDGHVRDIALAADQVAGIAGRTARIPARSPGQVTRRAVTSRCRPRPGPACRFPGPGRHGADRVPPPMWSPWRPAPPCGCARSGTWAGRGPQPDGRRTGGGPRTLCRRRPGRAPAARRARHAGPRHRRRPGAGGMSRAFGAGRLSSSRGRPFRLDRPGKPHLAQGHGGARGHPFRCKRPAGRESGRRVRWDPPPGSVPDTPGKAVVPKSRASKPAERPPWFGPMARGPLIRS